MTIPKQGALPCQCQFTFLDDRLPAFATGLGLQKTKTQVKLRPRNHVFDTGGKFGFQGIQRIKLFKQGRFTRTQQLVFTIKLGKQRLWFGIISNTRYNLARFYRLANIWNGAHKLTADRCLDGHKLGVNNTVRPNIGNSQRR